MFEWSGTSWVQTQKLISPTPYLNHRFGKTTAMKGDCALIGEEHNNDRQGKVYFYERSAGTWSLGQELTASDGHTKDFFGGSLAINDSCDMALINAWGKEHITGGGSCPCEILEDVGVVYVFERILGVWTEVQKIEPPDPGAEDWFGFQVSFNGDYALLGEEGDDTFAEDSGSLFVFQRVDGTWIQKDRLFEKNPDPYGWFGEARLDGTSAIVSAPGSDINAPEGGAAWVYEFDQDDDLVWYFEDNCDSVFNPDQTDTDEDGHGDACVPPGAVSPGVDLGSGSTVGAGSELHNGVSTGQNAQIGENATLDHNVVAGENLLVGDGTTINQNVVMGDDVTVGAYSVIAKDAMVESNVTLGERVEIAKGVFIGAGTVIDDEAQVKKDSQIGTNVSIGARVIIGAGVVIAAGTHIPDDTVIPNGVHVP
jgi:acetyltransferase-like isoleucine patch superfamily enzyme